MSARGRVTEFLRQWDLRKGNDRNDTIYGVFNDPDAEMAELLASDVAELLEAPVYWTAGDIGRELGLALGASHYWIGKLPQPTARTHQGMKLLTEEQAQWVIEAYRKRRAEIEARNTSRKRGLTWRHVKAANQTADEERAERALQYLLAKDTA